MCKSKCLNAKAASFVHLDLELCYSFMPYLSQLVLIRGVVKCHQASSVVQEL
jgi:hypothetical protein